MKILTLALAAMILSAPALAQQSTSSSPSPPVVKKRTPSLTLEGGNHTLPSQAELDREEAKVDLVKGMKELDEQLDADEQHRQENNAEARRLIDSRIIHRKAPRRVSPFRLKH